MGVSLRIEPEPGISHINAIFPPIFFIHKLRFPVSHRIGGNRKRYQQSTNSDQKSIETAFSIAICRQWGDKRQSKTLFILIIIYIPR